MAMAGMVIDCAARRPETAGNEGKYDPNPAQLLTFRTVRA